MAKSYDIAFKLGAKLNKNYGETFNKAQEFADKTVSKIKKTVIAIGALVLSASAITGAIDTYKGFEQSMANTAAIAGIDQTSEAYALLEEAALDAGKATTKTAQEAADALGYMALAGWDVETSMKALMPVLRLSEASGMDLALASDMVTDTMSALGIAVDGAALGVDGLTGYLDLVAKAQNSSNMTAQQMMDAYLGVGGTLKSLNVEMSESAAVLGVMANRGTKGTEAATSLSRIITNMTAPSGKAATALEKLGYSAFDSEGNFIGLENALVLLQDKLAGANDEQMQYFTSAIGGQSALTELQQILDGLGDEYYELKEAILDNEGALDTMAATMNNTMQGAFARLNSAVDDFKIRMVKQFEPYITPAINKIAEKIPLISEKLGAVGDFISNIIIPRFSDFTNRAGNAFERIKIIAATAYNNLMAVIENNQPKLQNIISTALDIKEKLAAAFEAAKPIIEWIFTDGLPAVVDVLIGVLDGVTKVYNFINDNWSVLGPIFIAIATAVGTINFTKMAIEAGKATVAFVNLTKAKIIDNAETLYLQALYAKDFLVSLPGRISAATKAFAALTKAKIVEKAETIYLHALYTKDAIVRGASTVATWAQTAAATAWNVVAGIGATVTTAFGAAIAFLTSPIGLVILAITALIAIAVLVVKNWDVVKEFFLNLWEKVKEAASGAWAFISGIWATVAGWFDENVIQPVVSFFSGLGESIVGFFQGAWSGVTDIWNKIGSWVDDNVIQPVVNFFGNLVEKITNIGKDISQALKDMFTSPINWIKDKWSGVTGFFGGLFGGGGNVSVPSVPGYATGTNYTPDTFIAGEEGPELITNSAGRKVYDAVETSSIFNKLSSLSSKIKFPEIGNMADMGEKVKTFILGPEKENNPFVIKEGRDRKGSTDEPPAVFQISYAPQIKVESSGSSDDIKKIIEELLKKDKEDFEKKVIEIMETVTARKERLTNA